LAAGGGIRSRGEPARIVAAISRKLTMVRESAKCHIPEACTATKCSIDFLHGHVKAVTLARKVAAWLRSVTEHHFGR
jgi:hypothetical protein